MTRRRTRSGRSPRRPRRFASPPPPRRATTMPAATTNKPAYAVFETAIGRCALVWRGGLVIGAALPEADEARLRARIARRFPGAREGGPPDFAGQAIALVRRLLAGEKLDLADIPIDLSDCSDFERDVYAAARAIPCGGTRTYGE